MRINCVIIKMTFGDDVQKILLKLRFVFAGYVL